jgi:hypothetical protein
VNSLLLKIIKNYLSRRLKAQNLVRTSKNNNGKSASKAANKGRQPFCGYDEK